MKIRHSPFYQCIELWPIKHQLSNAIRKSLRIGSNPIVLFRIELSNCLNAELIAKCFDDFTHFIRQRMLRAFSRRSKNIAEGTRLALIRSEAIWSVHRVHEYCGQIWILYAGEHCCDGSPHTHLY